jgi:hypothetical protein
VFAWVDSVIAFFDRIPQWWNSFTIWIGALNPFALVGAGIGLIVADFDTITQWWIGFAGWIGTLNPFALVGAGIGLIVANFDTIKNWWSEFKSWLAALNPFAGISSAADSLMRGIQSITGAKINMATAPAAQPTALDKLSVPSAITGPQTAAPSLSAMSAQPKWLQQPAPGLLTDGFTPPQPVAAPAALTQSQTTNVPKGGIMSQINNADNSKSVSVGGITVHNYGQPVTGQRLADEIAMAAG